MSAAEEEWRVVDYEKPQGLRRGVSPADYNIIEYKDVKGVRTPFGLDRAETLRYLHDSRVVLDFSERGSRTGEPYVWCGDHYVPCSGWMYTYVMDAVRAHVGDRFAPSAKSVEDTVKAYVSDREHDRVKMVSSAAPRDVAQFSNGWVDPLGGELTPPDESVFVTTPPLNAEYDQSAPEHEALQAALDAVLPDPDDQRLVLEFAGYTLYSHANDLRAFMVLQGAPASGKSWVMSLVQAVLGRAEDGYDADRFTTVHMCDMGDPHQAISLRDARANFAPEHDRAQNGRIDTARLKDRTAGGIIRARLMYRDFVSFPCRTKEWVATNTAPDFGGDAGVSDRLLYVEMNEVQSKEKGAAMYALLKDPAARTWFAMMALWAYQELRKNNGVFSVSAARAEAKAELTCDSDCFQRWVTALCGELGRSVDYYGLSREEAFVNYCFDKDRGDVWELFRRFQNQEASLSGRSFKPLRMKEFKQEMRSCFGLVDGPLARGIVSIEGLDPREGGRGRPFRKPGMTERLPSKWISEE